MCNLFYPLSLSVAAKTPTNHRNRKKHYKFYLTQTSVYLNLNSKFIRSRFHTHSHTQRNRVGLSLELKIVGPNLWFVDNAAVNSVVGCTDCRVGTLYIFRPGTQVPQAEPHKWAIWLLSRLTRRIVYICPAIGPAIFRKCHVSSLICYVFWSAATESKWTRLFYSIIIIIFRS